MVVMLVLVRNCVVMIVALVVIGCGCVSGSGGIPELTG